VQEGAAILSAVERDANFRRLVAGQALFDHLFTREESRKEIRIKTKQQRRI
jgi:hypothetical protein